MPNEMLVYEVVPRLRNVARTMPKVGHEDDEEIIQDATLMAARMMASAEKAGKTITAGNASSGGVTVGIGSLLRTVQPPEEMKEST